MKTDQIQAALDNLLRMFECQQFPAAIGLQLIRRRSGEGKPSDSWSLLNNLMMLAAGTQDARGYRQWQQVGRQVRKGSKAIFILAPLQKVTNRQSEADPDDLAEDRLVLRIIGFRLVPVFKVEDTEGTPLPEPTGYAPTVLPPLYEVAGKLGLTVKYQPFDGRSLGSYRPATKSIALSETSPLTYLHELCHAVDHAMEPIRPGRLAEAELVAELGGATLAALYGFTGTEHSTYQYLKCYAREHEPQAVLRCLANVTARVEQIVGRIFELAEKPFLPEQQSTVRLSA